MALRPGMVVADVGAGDGEWSERLATRVGPSGHVYATEIDEDELGDLRERVEDAGLQNVTVIQGTATDTRLPGSCCDAILLRLVYHHMTNPDEMRASLRQALRTEGLLIVIDIEPQTQWRKPEGVPDRGGHGISPEDLIWEMSSDGFTVVSRDDHWHSDEDRYCVVFRR
jgi:ubiquinone/menaquinone biosynthesis C-methylase UbiE